MEHFSQHVVEFFEFWRTKSAGGKIPGTVTHADFRGDNFFILSRKGEEEPEAVVVDWQTPKRSVGELDVAEILAGSLDSHIRRSVEAEICLLYHAQLCASIYSDQEGGHLRARREYPLAICLANFQLGCVYAARRAMGVQGILQTKTGRDREESLGLFKEMSVRGLDCLADWDCQKGLEAHLARQGRPPTVEEALAVLPPKLRALCGAAPSSSL